jgi:phosphopantothenoylcysteine decarboxylase/phosphopantothenate--cysteine ligase
MNNRMWENPIAQENFAKLASLGYRFIGPEAGWLACRNVGAGRLTDPRDIVEEVAKILAASPAKGVGADLQSVPPAT